MIASWLRAGRKWARVACVGPALAAVQLGGLQGVPRASACTGGEPGVGWQKLSVPIIASEEERLPVASDGFVLLSGAIRASDAGDAELVLPAVSVTTQSGSDVPGTLRRLRSQSEGDLTVVELGWQATEALPVGTIATLSWSLPQDDGGFGGAGASTTADESVELEVVAEPTPLPKPSALLGDWVDVRHGVGELVTCESDTSCGSYPLEAPTDEVRVPGVAVTWRLPQIDGLVAWEVWAESSNASDGVVPLTPPRRQLVDRARDVLQATHHVVAFGADAEEHCAIVVVKDLRTGEESRSAPQCGEPQQATAAIADHALSRCADPPTPESKRYWCLDRPFDDRCAPVDEGSAGQPGTGGQGSAGHDSGSASDDTQLHGDDDDGCNYSGSRGQGVLVALVLAGVSFVSRRRKLRRS